MSAKAGGVIRPGDADAELASRAARRIRDYLAAHPGTDPVRIRGNLLVMMSSSFRGPRRSCSFISSPC
jgi:hypothetical protein